VLTIPSGLDLPQYMSEHLERSPLVLVAAQINFEEVDREVSHALARAFQKVAGDHWRRLQAAPIVTATMTAAGTVSEAPRQAYRLLSADESWSALLNPGSVTVETKDYPGWQAMKDVIASLAHAVEQVYDPASELRLGLRYVDQVTLPEGSEDWRELIPESFLGLALDPRLGSAVVASDQRILLQLDEINRCLLRHGLLANEQGEFGKIYLLDYDAFRENAGAYAASEVEVGIEALHDYVGQLFRASLTDKLHAWLKG
jgi:uncharacterized protein (TIGR04255 family)